MSKADVTKWTIEELQQHIQNKSISPVEVTTILIEKAIAENKRINAFIEILSEQALVDARIAESEIMQGKNRSALHGIPIGIKDLIDVKGVRTTCASEFYKDNIAHSNAAIINQLKEKGAIIYCKENMHTLAFGS